MVMGNGLKLPVWGSFPPRPYELIVGLHADAQSQEGPDLRTGPS